MVSLTKNNLIILSTIAVTLSIFFHFIGDFYQSTSEEFVTTRDYVRDAVNSWSSESDLNFLIYYMNKSDTKFLINSSNYALKARNLAENMGPLTNKYIYLNEKVKYYRQLELLFILMGLLLSVVAFFVKEKPETTVQQTQVLRVVASVDVKDLKSKLEFLTTLAIFLGTVINLFFRVNGGADSADKVSFKFSLSVIFYLGAYLFLHMGNNIKYLNHKIRVSRFLNKITIANIFFIMTWLVMSVTIESVDKFNNIFEVIYTWIYVIVVWATFIIIPFILFMAFMRPREVGKILNRIRQLEHKKL
ncbi:MAG: hypothetical protein AABX00_00310 [Nanoarchaeota archaeon]